MSAVPPINGRVSEAELAAWRAEHLDHRKVLRWLDERPDDILAIGAQVGVGKSSLIDRILADPATYDTFALVCMVAPSWAIIRDRAIVAGLASCPEPWVLLEPRPGHRCGPLDAAWQGHEQASRVAYGKQALCSTCPHRFAAEPCIWPDGIKARIGDARLAFFTDQQIVLNRLLPYTIERMAGGRVLYLYDEGTFIDKDQEVVVPRRDLVHLRSAVAGTAVIPGPLAQTWLDGIDALLAADSNMVACTRWVFPQQLSQYAADIQATGIGLVGQSFRYVGYEVSSLAGSRGDERYKDVFGQVRFVARPYLGRDAIILSANQDPAYLADRLGRSSVYAPFDGAKVMHSETTVYNLKNRIGADCYFDSNKRQLLDFFAMLLYRNIRRKRTTVLVARKHRKAEIAEYLGKRLEGWGCSVRFITDDYDNIGPPDPEQVVLVHYGVRGVNHLKNYETCYCVGSYYVPEDELGRMMQEGVADPCKGTITVGLDAAGYREVRMALPGIDTPPRRVRRGKEYLNKSEIDPVIQAVGRVRFFTEPREVMLFQLHDLSAHIDGVIELGNLAQARKAFGLPPSAVEIDHLFQRLQLQRAMDNKGWSLRKAAEACGVDKTTASRRLRDTRLNHPFLESIRAFETAGEWVEA